MKTHKLLRFNEDHCDEMNVPALTVMTNEEFEAWKKSEIYLYAYLGNWGDRFSEKYEDCTTGEDFINEGYVDVTDVTSEFATTFHTANLASLSLCSIFG